MDMMLKPALQTYESKEGGAKKDDGGDEEEEA